MYKKGHTGMIKVKRATEEKAGTLEIKVRIGGNEAKTGNVKDLKQLSGETFTPSPYGCRAGSIFDSVPSVSRTLILA